MKRLLFSIAMLVVIAPASHGQADIYRFDGEGEVISFSDTPNDKRYLLVMKEKQPRRVVSAKGSYLAGKKAPASSPPPQLEQNSDLARFLPIQGVITSPTGLRTDPFDGRLKHHNGLDIAAPSGTPVKPVARGTVIYSGWKSGYGNTVILEHGDGMVTVYAHHASNKVMVGDMVDTQTIIALTGSTGRSTGPHLHFEAWQGGSNITADFMPGTTPGRHSATLAEAPVNRILQKDGTLLFTNLR